MISEPYYNEKSQLEIDESKVININHDKKWMLGICDRDTYDIRIFMQIIIGLEILYYLK